MGQERRNRRKFLRLTLKRYKRNLAKLEKRDEHCPKHIWRYKILGENEFGWECQECNKQIIDETRAKNLDKSETSSSSIQTEKE
jgi:hypothetical protein